MALVRNSAAPKCAVLQMSLYTCLIVQPPQWWGVEILCFFHAEKMTHIEVLKAEVGLNRRIDGAYRITAYKQRSDR